MTKAMIKGEDRFIRVGRSSELRARISEIGCPRWLIINHGVGEYLERHTYFIDLFGHDFNILFYDLRGHGRSGGERAYVENFYQFAEDLGSIIDFLEKSYKMKNFFLFGHSMGAQIVCAYMQRYAHHHLYPDLVFINAPPIAVHGLLGKLVDGIPNVVMSKLSSFPKNFPLPHLIDPKALSHDFLIQSQYRDDEFILKTLGTKLIFEMLKASREIFSSPINLTCPAYCTVGTEDRLVSVRAIKKYFTEVEGNFHFQTIEGAYHEIHNEISRYRQPYFGLLKEVFFKHLYGEQERILYDEDL